MLTLLGTNVVNVVSRSSTCIMAKQMGLIRNTYWNIA